MSTPTRLRRYGTVEVTWIPSEVGEPGVGIDGGLGNSLARFRMEQVLGVRADGQAEDLPDRREGTAAEADDERLRVGVVPGEVAVDKGIRAELLDEDHAQPQRAVGVALECLRPKPEQHALEPGAVRSGEGLLGD